MWGVDIFHSSSFYIVAKLLPKMLKVKKFCVSLSSVIRNSLNNYVFPFHCTLGVKGSAVILACQGEPFWSLLVLKKTTIVRQFQAGRENASKSAIRRSAELFERLTVLRLEKAGLIFDWHHLKAPFFISLPSCCFPWKLFNVHRVGSLPSAAGQTNSAFVIFEEIAGGLEVKCL